jgi:transcriptional regulator with XRE-family HTH domain
MRHKPRIRGIGEDPRVDPLRIGRSLRVIRRSRGKRQLDVARAAGVSQTLVSAVERGHGDRLAVAPLGRLFAALQADVDLVVRYRGGTLDRLLDERHAATVADLVGTLRSRGWTTAVEVTFNHYGDRESIDVLAVHPVTRTALVVEVRTEIAPAEETMRRLDAKVRLGAGLARQRFGLPVTRVVPLLAILDSTANRRRVVRLAPLLDPAFPNRSTDLRHWLASPGTPAGGLLFVSVSRGRRGDAGMSGPHRVRRRQTAVTRDP